MKIDGRAIAENILADLKIEVEKLKERGVTPTLAVILVGDNPASLSYIKQKQKAAEKIGAKIELHQIKQEELTDIIKKCNDDRDIHGIIIQRPLPGESASVNDVKPEKDVDGFVQNSPYTVPVAAAVEKILALTGSDPVNKRMVIIGRGETAGKPIFAYFQKLGLSVSCVHSQTKNPEKITTSADVLVSCVGKPNVVRRDTIKEQAILISVGLWRDNEGKLHGDYEESEIENKASFYTPTPGGVGPVNVACLMKNLVDATKKISDILWL